MRVWFLPLAPDGWTYYRDLEGVWRAIPAGAVGEFAGKPLKLLLAARLECREMMRG